MKKDEKMSIEDMTAYMRIVPERKAADCRGCFPAETKAYVS